MHRSNRRLSGDDYVRTFDAEECAVIEFALLECYRRLKNFEDEWHLEQACRIKQLLEQRFEMRVDDRAYDRSKPFHST
jgi:hypothetical protein